MIYTNLGVGVGPLAGSRADGSAHMLMRVASGIEMALWDLAGKILNVPMTVLLGGEFRDNVRVCGHAAPRDLPDKQSCAVGQSKSKQTPPASPRISSVSHQSRKRQC